MHPLNEKIRLFRIFLGYSQQNLADDCHVSQRTISKIERGEMKNYEKHLPSIATALGLDLAELERESLDELLKKMPPAPSK